MLFCLKSVGFILAQNAEEVVVKKWIVRMVQIGPVILDPKRLFCLAA